MSLKTWFLDFLGNIRTEKGKIEETLFEEKLQEIYYKELAIQTAVVLIANALSACEIKVYEKGQEVKNKFYYRLNVSPNKNENASQLWHKAIEKMIYEKEALIVEIGEELFVVDSKSEEEKPLEGNIYTGICIGNEYINRRFQADEVIRLKLNDVNIKKLIDSLYEQYGELLALAANNFKKNNQRKYKLKLENTKAGDKKFQKEFDTVVKSQLKKFMDNDNVVYPQFKGYDLEDVSSTTKTDSSDFRALRKEIFEIVAQAFQIPLSLMMGNVTNIDEIAKVFLTFSIDPLADMITKETTRKYSVTYEEWAKGNYTKVDTSTIKHLEILDVAEKADKLIASGTCCIDEVREVVGFDKLDTEFSKQHFITKNYDTVENRLIGDSQTTLNEGGEQNEE